MFRDLMNKLAQIEEAAEVDLGIPVRLLRPDVLDIWEEEGDLMALVDGWENISSAADRIPEGPQVITYHGDSQYDYMIDGSHHLTDNEGPISVTTSDGSTFDIEYLSDLEKYAPSFLEHVAAEANRDDRFEYFDFEPVDERRRPLSRGY